MTTAAGLDLLATVDPLVAALEARVAGAIATADLEELNRVLAEVRAVLGGEASREP